MEQDEQIIRIGNYTSQFEGKDLLGTGGFDVVYVGHQINNRKNKVAIKIISLEQSSQKQIIKQALYMLNFHSEGTLEILASGKIKFGPKKQQCYAIITEKMNGNLRDLLKDKGKLTEVQAIEWGRKIIECYKYIYKAKAMHKNLKPDNVLYKKFGDQIIFKIADFGLSRNLNSSNLSNKNNAFYVSPQQEDKQGIYTDKTDVYAFGCMMLEFLVGPKKLFSEVIKLIYTNNESINKKEAVKVATKVLGNIGASKIMIQLIEGCLMYKQSDRLAWKDVFDHKIFQEAIGAQSNRISVLINQEKKKLYLKEDINMEEPKINKLRMTPDTTTYAWKQKLYRQDKANNRVCIYQGPGLQWLCSSQFCNHECVFTIKVHKVKTQYNDCFKRQVSYILIGIMDSQKKGEKWVDTKNHCVYLSVAYQTIWRPNQEQTNSEGIKCFCQPLASFPCLIEYHIDHNQNTITWHYNGKDQAKSSIPNSWKDSKKLCAIVLICNQADTVEFM